jgi:hypothetical protein
MENRNMRHYFVVLYTLIPPGLTSRRRLPVIRRLRRSTQPGLRPQPKTLLPQETQNTQKGEVGGQLGLYRFHDCIPEAGISITFFLHSDDLRIYSGRINIIKITMRGYPKGSVLRLCLSFFEFQFSSQLVQQDPA